MNNPPKYTRSGRKSRAGAHAKSCAEKRQVLKERLRAKIRAVDKRVDELEEFLYQLTCTKAEVPISGKQKKRAKGQTTLDTWNNDFWADRGKI